MKITTTQETILKFNSTNQSSEINLNEKVQLPKGTILEIDSTELIEGHYQIKGYIFNDHVKIDNVKIDLGATNNEIPRDYNEVNWNEFLCPVSKYFTVGEVTNNDARRIPKNETVKQNIFTLAQELDKIREEWGSAIRVTSWYRPPLINSAIGGARNSQHIYGKAADIAPVKGNIYRFQDWLDKGLWSNKALGYGAKKGFIHIDLRPGKIRWNY